MSFLTGGASSLARNPGPSGRSTRLFHQCLAAWRAAGDGGWFCVRENPWGTIIASATFPSASALRTPFLVHLTGLSTHMGNTSSTTSMLSPRVWGIHYAGWIGFGPRRRQRDGMDAIPSNHARAVGRRCCWPLWGWVLHGPRPTASRTDPSPGKLAAGTGVQGSRADVLEAGPEGGNKAEVGRESHVFTGNMS